MGQKRTVTVRVKAKLPRQFVRGGVTRLTRKKYETWVTVGRFPVLYCDRNDLIVRTLGAISRFDSKSGHGDTLSWRPDHPAYKKLPANWNGMFIHPTSLAALKADGYKAEYPAVRRPKPVGKRRRAELKKLGIGLGVSSK